MGAIGVFPEEQKAYDLVMKLLWILPTVVLGGALVDAMFVSIYFIEVFKTRQRTEYPMTYETTLQ